MMKTIIARLFSPLPLREGLGVVLLLLMGSASLQAQGGDPFGEVNIHKYQGSMTITSQVMMNGNVVTDAVVAVYCENELREKKSVGNGTNPNLVFLTVHGDYTGSYQYLYFKVYTDGHIFTCHPDPAIDFDEYYYEAIGTASNPYIIDITPVGLVNNADNSSVLTTWKDKTCDVVLYGRTLSKSGNWNTLCLPFGLASFIGTPLEGATVKTLGNSPGCKTGYDASTGTLTLDFVPAYEIEPGVAYIVRWEDSEGTVSNPVFTGVTISNEDPADHSTTSSDGAVTFIGTYSPTLLEKDVTTNLFMGAGNTLYYPNVENFYVNAFRAYFRIDPSASVKAFVLNFDGSEDDADGIGEIHNSQFTIHNEADAIYNLAGQRVTPHRGGDEGGLPSGIYIVNGRKVLK